jgi:transposase
VIIEHTNRRVLEVWESREKATVVKYLRAARERGLRAHGSEVTTDMWDAYVAAAREVCGEAVASVIDRFPVVKNLQEQLTAARREIHRTLPAEAARALQGSRWLWLTNPENLDEAEAQHLTELKTQCPRLAQLAEQRDALRHLFVDAAITTPEAGMPRLREWSASARALELNAMNKFGDTLERWLDKIANYFLYRSSNGPTEGFNNGLRTLLRRAFGMTNFHHFRLRGLDRFGHPHPQEST